ncbi:hypothetical protein F5Y16DRAFT_393130 [Xylariaceae sp. FL0255]|nr:hypothetical protein F5Y16DRAFT_393130 [Xylariaceae sp. FL0255]
MPVTKHKRNAGCNMSSNIQLRAKTKVDGRPRSVFIPGTLRALPLLAWALTGDSSRVDYVMDLTQPAILYGYERYGVKDQDYPAVVKSDRADSCVDGLLLEPETTAQRKRLDIFEGIVEGGNYKIAEATVNVVKTSHPLPLHANNPAAHCDLYLWARESAELTNTVWDYELFKKKKLPSWLAIYEGMQL